MGDHRMNTESSKDFEPNELTMQSINYQTSKDFHPRLKPLPLNSFTQNNSPMTQHEPDDLWKKRRTSKHRVTKNFFVPDSEPSDRIPPRILKKAYLSYEVSRTNIEQPPAIHDIKSRAQLQSSLLSEFSSASGANSKTFYNFQAQRQKFTIADQPGDRQKDETLHTLESLSQSRASKKRTQTLNYSVDLKVNNNRYSIDPQGAIVVQKRIKSFERKL